MFRRRRRPVREVLFSFDAFLDVVANVVGIILRLILVAWVGARSYKVIVPPPPPLPPPLAAPVEPPVPEDPRTADFPRQRLAIAESRQTLVGRERERGEVADVASELDQHIAQLLARRLALQAEQAAQDTTLGDRVKQGVALNLTLRELQQRSKKLVDELAAMRKLPSQRKELRYLAPISAPVKEEVMFECQRGRVTLLDTAALLEIAYTDARSRSEELKTQWQFSDRTRAVGAFRLHYVVAREKKAGDNLAGGPATGGYRYGLHSWRAEPVEFDRGETAEQALTKDSAFRQVIDHIDQQTAVTMWVYPDSFALYRQLRDALHARGLVVAGRPLPESATIGASPDGSVSRGQ